jgi:hypothetical protein
MGFFLTFNISTLSPMINPSGIRVNVSLVYYHEEITTATSLHLYKGEYMQFNGIPLTEELLKVLQVPKFKGFSIYKNYNGEFELYHDGCPTGAKIKHFHEFQNIYQAITGSEFTVTAEQMGTFLFLACK